MYWTKETVFPRIKVTVVGVMGSTLIFVSCTIVRDTKSTQHRFGPVPWEILAVSDIQNRPG